MANVKKAPFSRGVNFTKWFEFKNVKDIPFEKFIEQDFINIKSLGADVVRLPISMHYFTKSEKDLTIDPLLLKYLDTVVDWAEKHQVYLILDNHSFHPINATDPNIDKILIPVWEQFARHFKARSDYLIYEILNEPHHICDERWGKIQGDVIDAVRKIDKKHTIIVGGTDYNSIAKLLLTPEYKDDNLIYTFHYYDPHLFTHQGATWNEPSLAPLSGLTFPADAGKKPAPHKTFVGTWVEDCLNGYEDDAETEKMSAALDKTAAFAKERGVPIFCGEFGVFKIQSPPEDRVRWYKFVCDELNKRDIPWTSWDYFGGFGIFNIPPTQWRGEFPADLNVDLVKAMGFKL
jgi:endoglucanase